MYTGIIMKIDYPRVYLHLLHIAFCLVMGAGLYILLIFSALELLAIALFAGLILGITAEYRMCKNLPGWRGLSITVNIIITMLCLTWFAAKGNLFGHGRPTEVEGVLGVLIISVLWVETQYWGFRYKGTEDSDVNGGDES